MFSGGANKRLTIVANENQPAAERSIRLMTTMLMMENRG